MLYRTLGHTRKCATMTPRNLCTTVAAVSREGRCNPSLVNAHRVHDKGYLRALSCSPNVVKTTSYIIFVAKTFLHNPLYIAS